MPAIRDARGVLTVHDMGALPINPPGPVERRQASAARMADFAAERVAAAERVVVAAPAERNLGRRVGRPRVTPEQRQARTEEFLEAVRSSASHADAGKKLGLSGARVAQFISELRRAGQLPVDVDNLLRARSGQRQLPVEENGREGDGPATDVATAEPPGTAPAAEVATPLGQLSLTVAGEDRCPFARKLDTTLVVVCDREPHDGGHRGRLIRIGLQDASVLGHAAVPA